MNGIAVTVAGGAINVALAPGGPSVDLHMGAAGGEETVPISISDLSLVFNTSVLHLLELFAAAGIPSTPATVLTATEANNPTPRGWYHFWNVAKHHAKTVHQITLLNKFARCLFDAAGEKILWAICFGEVLIRDAVFKLLLHILVWMWNKLTHHERVLVTNRLAAAIDP